MCLFDMRASSLKINAAVLWIPFDCVQHPNGSLLNYADVMQKAGPRFEATVRNKEKANPRFAFLLPWNQFHTYYR